MYGEDLTLFREYEPHECGTDGYPHVWHRIPSEALPGDLLAVEAERGRAVGVKDVVRIAAGDRCVRCLHPFTVGSTGTWDDDGPAHPPEANGGFQHGENVGWAALAFWPDDDPDVSVDGGDAIRGNKVHWSPCDARCTHGGPIRAKAIGGGWQRYDDDDAGPLLALRETVGMEAAWRILTVHHLNGRKHDLRWWNLASLCQRCHLTIQKKVVMEAVYPLEHSDWFKPYAAGWYAYAYLGENLPRSVVERRQEDLLALERLA